MKRLLSWLLALVMIISCLPMSALPAFAAEPEVETGTEDPNFTVDMSLGELVPLSLAPTSIPYTFEKIVPAGKTAYYAGSVKLAGLVATNNITGEEITLTVSDDNMVYYNIVNNTDAEVTYSITLDYPLGSENNKKVIDTMLMSKWSGGYGDSISLAAGNSTGYWYSYTAEADGTMTVCFYSVPSQTVTSTSTDDEGNETTTETEVDYTCDIVVTNNTAMYQKTFLMDGVDNNGMELAVEVTEGDEIFIQVLAVEDPAGNWYPAADISWGGNLVATPGSELNPSDPWTWNDDYSEASATVTVAAGETVWYTSSEEMILTINGEVVEQAGKFSITNSGETEATYEMTMTYPVGHSQNPEVIENIDGYSDTNTTVENGNYNYIWTATEDGTVTLDVTDGANLTVDKYTYVEGQEYPDTVQYVLAEYAYNDDWSEFLGWTVQENLVIEVVAGEQLKIQVVGYSDVDAWTVPAVEYTLTGDFEAAVKCDHDSIANGGKCEICGLFKLTGTTATLGNALAINFVVTMANMDSSDTGHYAVITKEYADGTDNAVVTIPQSEWINYGSAARKYFTFDGIRAKEMTDTLTVVIYNSSDEVVSIEWIDSMRDYGMRALANEEKKSSPDSEKLTLYVDMLNYGAAAQVYFSDYHNDDYANSQLTEAQQAYATGDVTLTQDDYYKGTYQLGATLTLASNIVLNFVYNTTIDQTMYAVATYTDHNGVAQEIKIEGSKFVAYGSKGWIVPLESLKIADLNTKVTLTVYSADGNQVTYSTDSIAAYLARVASNDLYVAIAKFATSAYNSFH